MANRYANLEELEHAWFGAGWPDAEHIPALHDDILALIERSKPKHEARPPSPLTQIGRK